MPLGPGKYDAICTEARVKSKARGALLIVIDGEHGSGFSCQTDLDTLLRLPQILEDTAQRIRERFAREGI